MMVSVLPGVTDDAQPISRRIDVHAEEGAVQGCGQRRHPDGRRRIRVNRVDTPAVADAREQPVLRPEIDPYESGVRRLQPGHTPDLVQTTGDTLPKRDQLLICCEADDGQQRSPTQGAPALRRSPQNEDAIAGMVVSTLTQATTASTHGFTAMITPLFSDDLERLRLVQVL